METFPLYDAQFGHYTQDLRKQIETHLHLSPDQDDERLTAMRWIVRCLKLAQVFALPDDGNPLGADRIDTLEPPMRLPYPIITLEFRLTTPDTLNLLGTEVPAVNGHAKRNRLVILAMDAGHPIVRGMNPERLNDDDIVVVAISHLIEPDGWVLSNHVNILSPEPVTPEITANCVRLGDGHVVGLRWGEFEHHPDQPPPSQGEVQLVVSPVVALMKALQLKNIRPERRSTPPKLARAREKRGAPPLPDYHVLVIHGRQPVTHAQNGHGHHASPRTHLRRGHIRHLPNVGNIWINAMLINPGHGRKFAAKTYKVEPPTPTKG